MSYMYLIEICHQERFLRLSGKYILFLLIFEMNFIKIFGTCYHKYTIVKKSKKNQQNTRVGVSLQQDSPIDVFFVCKYPMPQCNSGYINKYITILRFEIITGNSVFFFLHTLCMNRNETSWRDKLFFVLRNHQKTVWWI